MRNLRIVYFKLKDKNMKEVIIKNSLSSSNEISDIAYYPSVSNQTKSVRLLSGDVSSQYLTEDIAEHPHPP
jgi:hypothetical protein